MFDQHIIQREKDADQPTEAREEAKDQQRAGHDFTETNELGKNPEIWCDERRQKIVIDTVRCGESVRHDRAEDAARRHERFGMRKFPYAVRKPKETDGKAKERKNESIGAS